MNYSDVEAFMAIVETGSLAKAADILYVSQPTVSRRLVNLEIDLGHTLAIRRKGQRAIHLTEWGEQFVPIAERWLSVWHETQQYKLSELTMHLSVGCTEWFNSFALKPFYSELMQKEPSLKMKVISSPSHLTYSKLNELEIDVGLVCNAFNVKGIRVVPLFRDPLVLVCHESSDWVKPTPISPACLNPAYEVEWNHLPDYRKWHNYWWASESTPGIVCDFSVSLCFGFVENPNFWIIVPLSVAKEFVGIVPGLTTQELTDKPPDFICYRIEPYLIRPSSQRSISMFREHLDHYVARCIERGILQAY